MKINTLTVIMFLSLFLWCFAGCSDDDDNGDSTDGDAESAPDGDIDADIKADVDKDAIESADVRENDSDADVELLSDFEPEQEVESEKEVASEIELEADNPFLKCSGACNPDIDMQYCLNDSHLCYCSIVDNTWKFHPPVESDNRYDCDCLTKNDVDYCGFYLTEICEINFCEETENGEIMWCSPDENLVYGKGVCTHYYDESNLPPESDCILDMPCDGGDTICIKYHEGLPEERNVCAYLCEPPDDTCEGFFPCMPFVDMNGKIFHIGICPSEDV